jgi:hypothetical protein
MKARMLWVFAAVALVMAIAIEIRTARHTDETAADSGATTVAPQNARRDDAPRRDVANETSAAALVESPPPAEEGSAATAPIPGLEGFGSPPTPFRGQLEALAVEPRDPDWSTAQEARILGEISQWKGMAFLNLQAECRTTTCVVLVVNPPDAKYTPFQEMEGLLHELNMGPRPSFTRKEPGGASSTWMFLGRVTGAWPPPSPPLPVEQ